MATVVDRFQFANKICELLGIVNENIIKIEIIIAPQDIVEILIHKVMAEDEGAKLLTEFEKRKFPNGTDKKE